MYSFNVIENNVLQKLKTTYVFAFELLFMSKTTLQAESQNQDNWIVILLCK